MPGRFADRLRPSRNSKALDQELDGDVYVGQPLNNDHLVGTAVPDLHPRVQRPLRRQRAPGRERDPEPGDRPADRGRRPTTRRPPFNSFKVNIDGGPRGALSTPFICGPHTTAATFTPVVAPNEDVTDSPSSQASAPGGGACPKTLGERPFAPGFTGGTRDPRPAPTARSTCTCRGPTAQQELKRSTSPCRQGWRRNWKASSTARRTTSPRRRRDPATTSWPSRAVRLAAWSATWASTPASGASPLHHRRARPTSPGPYKGAPVSLVMITPAVAGSV